jgi:hypothetical protein
MKFTPYTTLEELELLFAQEDRTRKSASSVKVDRQALKHLLMDHARFLEALKGRFDAVED